MHEEDEHPWVPRDATNNYVQPMNAMGGGGTNAFFAVNELRCVPRGYLGGTNGHDQAASRANDPVVNEGDTHHPYSASWEGYEATGWSTRAVR